MKQLLQTCCCCCCLKDLSKFCKAPKVAQLYKALTIVWDSLTVWGGGGAGICRLIFN